MFSTIHQFLNLNVLLVEASRRILVCILNPLVKCIICSIELMLWFRHFWSNNLNLSHASNNEYAYSWAKLIIMVFISTNWALEEYLSRNLSSSSFKVWITPFGIPCNQFFVRPIKGKLNKLNFTWSWVMSSARLHIEEEYHLITIQHTTRLWILTFKDKLPCQIY